MSNNSKDSGNNGNLEMSDATARVMERIPYLQASFDCGDTRDLKHQIIQALWNDSTEFGTEDLMQAQKREQIFEWVLKELAAFEIALPADLDTLRVLLTILSVVCSSDENLPNSALQLPDPKKFFDHLASLLTQTRLSFSRRQGPFDDNSWREKTLAAGRDGDYLTLGNSIRHIHLELPPEIKTTVLILAKLAPEKLAHHLNLTKDVFFSIAVRDVLYRQSLDLAKLVDDITFKFICVSEVGDVRLEHIADDVVDSVVTILLQLAQSNLWSSFLRDFVRYPKIDTVAAKAMSVVLPQVGPAHWAGFVDAVELWTHAPTAAPVASMLTPLVNDLGIEKSAEMWRLAFARWQNWDYGSCENEKHLSAPTSCSFDFPVAMYYALQPVEQTIAEESRLEQAIENVEQQWFTNYSELVTLRNRLSSRLRLVQYSAKIRNSSPEGVAPLPPPVQPDNEFAAIRYRFFDTQSGRGY